MKQISCIFCVKCNIYYKWFAQTVFNWPDYVGTFMLSCDFRQCAHEPAKNLSIFFCYRNCGAHERSLCEIFYFICCCSALFIKQKDHTNNRDTPSALIQND